MAKNFEYMLDEKETQIDLHDILIFIIQYLVKENLRKPNIYQVFFDTLLSHRKK